MGLERYARDSYIRLLPEGCRFESYLRSHSFLGLPENPQKESGSNKGHVKSLNSNGWVFLPGCFLF
jgi:hypothetical protein